MCDTRTTSGDLASSGAARTVAAIGLGSNADDSAAAIAGALVALARLGTVVRVSSLYRTRAWGVRDQPDFSNAAASLATAFEPHDLLRGLKAIEAELGRVATFRWGPRAIDLDILTYGGRVVDDPILTIPHRHLFERAFVLVPLAEIDPAFAAARDALGTDALAEVVLA